MIDDHGTNVVQYLGHIQFINSMNDDHYDVKELEKILDIMARN